MRSCGILMHISSLPSPYGIGTFGEEAEKFADWLKEAGQKYWQVLPIGPTGYGDSPDQPFSSFAGNPLLIDLDELQAKHPGSTIGRPHFALCLVEAGVAESVQDAFERFLDPGCKYYIRRHFLSVEDAAELIRSAGGKPVIAHPRQYKLTPERFTELMERARACGVAGLECYYSGYDAQTVAKYLAAAEEYGFCPTAGSDWHGKNKPHIHLGSGINGELAAPYEILEKLRDHE